MSKLKRGISPIIGVVLLISIVIVIASGVFLWTKGYTEKIFSSTESSSCRNVQFYSGDYCYDATAGKIEFSTRNDNENINISGFQVKLDYQGGSSVLDTSSENIGGEGKTKTVTAIYSGGQSELQIEIIPVINQNTVCSSRETIVNWTEIKPC